MPYKLVCSDIDGTLLNKARLLSIATITEIQRIKEHIPVILVSSRMPKAMTHLQIDLGIANSPLIAYNGGLVLTYNTDGVSQILSSIEVPNIILNNLLKINKTLDIHTSLYHNDEWYVKEMDYWAKREMNNTRVTPEIANLQEVSNTWKALNKGAHKVMCMGDEDQIQILANHIQTYFSNDLNAYKTKPTYLEISSKKISKLTALSLLLESNYQVLLEEVIAFGDNYNDIDMLQGVGLGVAVANAKDEVKTIANRITHSNIDDGVAAVLRELL